MYGFSLYALQKANRTQTRDAMCRSPISGSSPCPLVRVYIHAASLDRVCLSLRPRLRPARGSSGDRIGPSIARHIASTRLIRTRAHRINTHVGLSSLHRTPSRRATHTNRRAVEVESAHCRVEAAGIDRGTMRCGKARGEKAAQALCPTYIPSEARSPQDWRSQHD